MSKKKKFFIAACVIDIVAMGLFINSHDFHYHSPIDFHLPVTIVPHVKAQTVVKTVTVTTQDSLPLNDNERYLCTVFGDQCKTALMIQHLENGTEQCDRFHVNTNNSIDFGIMQINSVHLKADVTIADLVDCHKNIDIAYKIYKSSGWGAWTTAKQLGIK